MRKPIQFEFAGTRYSIGYGAEGINRGCLTPQEHCLLGSELDLPENTQPRDWLKPYGLLTGTKELSEITLEREKHSVLASALMAGLTDLDFNSTVLIFKLSPLNKNGETESLAKIVGSYNTETQEFMPYTNGEAERTMKLFLRNLEEEDKGEGRDFFESLECYQDNPRSGIESE